MKKVFSWILNHRVFITILIAICAFAAPSILLFAGVGSECTYYLVQSYTNAFIITGVVIAGWQYYLTSKNARKDFEIRQVQRAIDLAEYYKDNILRYYPAIRYIYRKCGLMDIVEKLKISQMKDFDTHELRGIFVDPTVEKFKKVQHSDQFAVAVLEANDIYALGLHISVKFANDKEKKKEDEKEQQYVISFTADLLNDLANNIEYFAMHFTHGTADESVVYQSLHQSYFEIMQILYYTISNRNANPSDKLYTNAIWLFETWKARKNHQMAERSEKIREVISPGTIIDK